MYTGTEGKYLRKTTNEFARLLIAVKKPVGCNNSMYPADYYLIHKKKNLIFK